MELTDQDKKRLKSACTEKRNSLFQLASGRADKNKSDAMRIEAEAYDALLKKLG